MTAEIALLNREAVAIAADSAVTFRTEGGYKILPSANKIFTLSKYHPVGVMVYGNAHLMDVPWELLIKSYRRERGAASLPSIEGYALDFMRFLSESRVFFPETMQNAHIEGVIRNTFTGLLKEILNSVGTAIATQGSLNAKETAGIVSDSIENTFELWSNVPFPSLQPDDLADRFQQKHADLISQITERVFEKLPLSDDNRHKLALIASWMCCKPSPVPMEGESGLVVAGYGDHDVYPSLRSYRIESIVENTLICAEDRKHDVVSNGSSVIPFAQSEMVYAFMEGIEPKFQAKLERDLTTVLQNFAQVAATGSGLRGKRRAEFQETLSQLASQEAHGFRESAKKYRYENIVCPALDVTSMLPKDELAAMAEALVNLTAFRRRISLDAETVGGPVDVAVISKGDGFIWIKRKHYFAPELNSHFFQNYFREI